MADQIAPPKAVRFGGHGHDQGEGREGDDFRNRLSSDGVTRLEQSSISSRSVSNSSNTHGFPPDPLASASTPAPAPRPAPAPASHFDEKGSTDPGKVRSTTGHYVLTDEQMYEWHVYRDLVGLSQPPNLQQPTAEMKAKYLRIFKSSVDDTRNLGVYQRIIDEELRAHIWYRTSTWVSNVLLLSQLCIAAAITSVGSSRGNFRLAITTLGAFNTVIAALLGFLKAKSLPASALQYREKLRKQKAEIDYMHRAYCVGTADVGAKIAADRAEDDFNKANNQFESSIALLQRQASGLGLGAKAPGVWRSSPAVKTKQEGETETIPENGTEVHAGKANADELERAGPREVV